MRATSTAGHVLFDLWGQRGWAGQEVAGESNYVKEIRSLFGDEPSSSELTVTAQLVPEPHNKHDRNAVSVQIAGLTVGYLPREDAPRYAPVLSALVSQGWSPQVMARVWGGERPAYDYDRRGNPVERMEFVGSVSLDLAEPHLLVPANRPPDDAYVLLPVGNAIQVTGEEDHMAALFPLLSPSGECWIHITLHEVVEQLARSTRTLVEIRVDGTVVGKLTPKMSGELLPVIRHLAARGAQTVARAILKGNSVKADVVLYVSRANQLTQDWLNAPPIQGTPRPVTSDTGTHLADVALPAQQPAPAATPDAAPQAEYGVGGTTSWHFNPPPGWPPPPPGWSPPPGWRPDPSWPPAPPDWQFWTVAPL